MSPETPPANGERPPSREHVAAALRRRIHDGDWHPGTSLPTQQELEAEFGVKRTVIRQALGILQREGLVAMGRGAPATVAETTPAHRETDGPRPAGVELADRVQVALQAPHVTIDAFSLTTETLNAAFSGAMPAITSGTLSPRSIAVRVLLPGPEARLAFPRPVSDDAGDSRPLERSHAKMRRYASTLRDQLLALQELELVPQVSIDIRTVAITPVQKLYLLNGTESLIGYYQLVEHSVEIDKEELEIYDAFGFRTKLFRSSNGPDRRDEQDAAFVEESQLWYESLWSTIARPFALD
ncbi:GntR family transcriptional regulator [Streptomyces armeniacus]|uniref:GntR family transcriptional regulator n=1 Tax=Streptomyces armeniacus TaxID=83291 RepID=UPI001AD7EF9F|nr:GntR family transcriptional regulator [Streptomyces armeniacus]